MSISSEIAKSCLRLRNWRILLGIIGIVFILIQAKLEIRKWEAVCSGENCVEIIFSFSDPNDFEPGLDKKKYRWVKVYKDGDKKIQYKRYFEYDNRAVFLVEKGRYQIKTDLGEMDEWIDVNEKREITLP